MYKLFYKFALTGGVIADGSSGELVFAHEMQKTYGHDGGAMLTVPGDANGRFFWAVGDCLPFGWNGLFAPQDDVSICGKMLLIDPTDGSYQIVAKGIRNSQQMFLQGEDVYFPDIGAVTAEEFNTVPLASLLDASMPNFGWGERDGDIRLGQKFAREVSQGCKDGLALPLLSVDTV